MSLVEQRQVMIEPIISYPREAQAGKSYIMTIDLQMKASYKDWPFDEEEYPIWFILNTDPLFSFEPFDNENAAVVLHRFGGTYGPATFLLTAAQQEMKGTLSIVLINDWGIPIEEIKIDCTIIAATPTISESPPVTYAQISQAQERSERLYQEDTLFNRSQNTLPVPVQIFCSYAHEDEEWMRRLETHLSLFKRQGLVSTWYDRQIASGANLAKEIDERLEQASIILLLVSPDFLASDYCYGAEMKRALERQEASEARVIPILVRMVDWTGAPFAYLQALPSDAKPIASWQSEKQALVDVAAGLRRVIEDVHLPAASALRAASPAIWNVPYQRNPFFTGRDQELERLHTQLQQENTAIVGQMQSISGLGGIGKTQIAVEYAYRSRDQSLYTHTFWINAASEETIIAGFVAIAELLPLFSVKNETDQRKLVNAVIHWLEQCEQRWLLIFDNADDVSLVRDYLPQRGNGSTMLTTRAHAVGSFTTSIDVETMGFAEGTQFLLRRTQRFEHASDEDINQAGNIAVALDYFPLALDQAGAYIEETKCSFTDYLEIYQTHRNELLARRGKQIVNYPNSIATTWSLSFQKVQQANPAAAELLHLCAFLAPDRIPEELITGGATYWPVLLQQAAADLFAFQQMIAELLKFSLVKRLVEEQALSIHRLVQAVQRDQMEPETQRQWAEKVIRAVNEVFPHDPKDIAFWPQCLRYLDQVQGCNNLVEHYTFTVIEAADLLNRAGLYLNAHASYLIAEPMFQRALTIQEQQLGPLHADIAITLSNLANLYRDLGNYNEAEPFYQRALHIQEQALKPDHPDVASSLNGLATLYRDQGKYAEAEPLVKRALSIREQQLGAQHPDTASSLDNLAALYYSQGKYAQAESLYVRALAIREQQLGAQHPDTALSLDNLAELYRTQGKYAEAEPLLVRALAIQEQQLGAIHPDTTQSLNNLAALYYTQGKYVEAEPLYVRALAIREQQLGATHPDTATSLNNLAMLYQDQAKYTEAESLYVRTLAIREQQLGATHPDTAGSLNNLATLYQDQAKYTEAESLLKQALTIYKQQLGTEHPTTQTIQANYIVLLEAMKSVGETNS